MWTCRACRRTTPRQARPGWPSHHESTEVSVQAMWREAAPDSTLPCSATRYPRSTITTTPLCSLSSPLRGKFTRTNLSRLPDLVASTHLNSASRPLRTTSRRVSHQLLSSLPWPRPRHLLSRYPQWLRNLPLLPNSKRLLLLRAGQAQCRLKRKNQVMTVSSSPTLSKRPSSKDPTDLSTRSRALTSSKARSSSS